MSGAHNKEHDALVARVRKDLEAEGCLTLHMKSCIVRRGIPIQTGIDKGWPDILCFRPGAMVEFFEVKTGTGRVEPEQKKLFAELVRLGFRVTIIRPKKAEEVFRWKNRKRK